MRLRKPFINCRFCGQVPKQLLLFDRISFGRRFYRCSLCGSSVYNEKITQKEIFTGNIIDKEFTGIETTYGKRYR